MDTSKVKDTDRFVYVYLKDVAYSVNGESIQEMIRWFYSHYNAILYFVYDVQEKITYIGKRNSEPDERGIYRYSYYRKDTNEKVFEGNDLCPPIKKIAPVAPDGKKTSGWIDREGNFYSCGYGMHLALAEELLLSKTVVPPVGITGNNAEHILEAWGWVKVSDCDFIYLYWKHLKKLTKKQFQAIKKLIKVYGEKTVEEACDLPVESLLEKFEGFM